MDTLKELLVQLEELNRNKEFNKGSSFASKLQSLRVLFTLKNNQVIKHRFFKTGGRGSSKYVYIDGTIKFIGDDIVFHSSEISHCCAKYKDLNSCVVLLKEGETYFSSSMHFNLKTD